MPDILTGVRLSKIWVDVQILVEPNCRALRDYCLSLAETGKESLHQKIKSKLNGQVSSFC